MPSKAILALAITLSLAVSATLARSADSATSNDLREIRREIERIKEHERDQEQRAKSDKARDDKLIQELEHRVQVIESQNLESQERQRRASGQARGAN